LFHLVLGSHDGRGLGADPEEKREPASDIDTAAPDSLKALDPKRPIREADIDRTLSSFAILGVLFGIEIKLGPTTIAT
jgi:hypothetical protein